MSRKVGRMTLAATLMIAGGIILVDNLLNTDVAWYIGRFWAVLLVFLGLEWISSATRAERDGTKVAFDGGAVIGLVIVAIIASNVSSWGRAPRLIQELRNIPNNVRVEIAVPEIDIPPITMPPITPPNPFGSVPADVVKTAPLTLAPGASLHLTTASGNVTVQDGAQAMVEMRVRGYGRSVEDAERTAESVGLYMQPSNEKTQVSAVIPPTAGRTDISFVVTLPKDAQVALTIDSSSGSVNVADRAGSVTITTSSGAIRAERIVGNVNLRANSGSVLASAITGDATASSTSGSVQVAVVSGNVKVNSTSGSVVAREVGGRLEALSSSGSITVDTETVGGDYDVSAVSGAVRVAIPASAGVNVTAKASSGRVTGPAWLTIGEGRNSGSGTQGDGAYRLNLKTTSGGISLEVR
ncbi:MAG: putative adhesin [Symbiobacteriaceae bacterium]|nr:putative adhesin [Symbiobacteriaceae bacterium]